MSGCNKPTSFWNSFRFLHQLTHCPFTAPLLPNVVRQSVHCNISVLLFSTKWSAPVAFLTVHTHILAMSQQFNQHGTTVFMFLTIYIFWQLYRKWSTQQTSIKEWIRPMTMTTKNCNYGTVHVQYSICRSEFTTDKLRLIPCLYGIDRRVYGI